MLKKDNPQETRGLTHSNTPRTDSKCPYSQLVAQRGRQERVCTTQPNFYDETEAEIVLPLCDSPNSPNCYYRTARTQP